MKRQVFMAALALGSTAAPVPGHAQLALQRPTIVLVHGGFVDGSGWQGVYKILRKDGYTVRIVQNPTISLAGDVAATRLIVDAQEGRVLLVGHSYGGAVITEAGNDPKVAGLVYITAFAPDKGESVNSLIKDPPPGAPVPPILPPQAHQFAVRWRHLQTCCGTPRGHTNARQVTIHPPRLCSSFPLSRRERGPGGEDRTRADRKGYIVGTMGRYASMLLASAVVGLAPLVAGCTERTPR